MSADDDHVTTATETGEITEPFTEKLSLGKTWYGYCAMQGWRPHMEDRHHHMKHLDRERWRHWAYFAIFDGHSGRRTIQRRWNSPSSYRFRRRSSEERVEISASSSSGNAERIDRNRSVGFHYQTATCPFIDEDPIESDPASDQTIFRQIGSNSSNDGRRSQRMRLCKHGPGERRTSNDRT